MHNYGIPEVFESEAHGIIKEVYEDIKFVLKVPIVNFIFRALANYPAFLVEAWEQVRPSMLTTNIESASNHLRFPTITTNVPHADFGINYSLETLQHIQNIIATFQYVNPKLLLIANAWAESLGNRPIYPKKDVFGKISPGIMKGMPQIELIHIPKASPYLKELLLDIAKVHHSYDIASDYRALARFPRFLQVSWYFLKPFIKSDEYTLLKTNLFNQSLSIIRQELPFPVTINPNRLTKNYSPSDISGIMGLVSLFQHFLPGLIVEIEFIRSMLTQYMSLYGTRKPQPNSFTPYRNESNKNLLDIIE